MAAVYALVDASTQERPVETISELLALVGSLDGEGVTMIVLERAGDDARLTLGGGPERLLVFYDRGGEPPFDALRTCTPLPAPARLVAGGQPGDFDREIAVTPDEAVVAALEFFNTGGRTAILDWRRE